jgi:hypothetical protein
MSLFSFSEVGFSLFFSSVLGALNPVMLLKNLEAFLTFSAFSLSFFRYSLDYTFPFGPMASINCVGFT